jgi:serine/threonine protein kinase
MPVEQATGGVVDERADVYALGAMLYHVLSGAPPYRGASTDEILAGVIKGPPPPLATRVAGVPPDLDAIVVKAMAHDAGQRYPSARELASDLKKFQTGQLVGAHRYSTWQLVRRWIQRHRTPVAVAVIAALLLIAVGVISLPRPDRRPAPDQG